MKRKISVLFILAGIAAVAFLGLLYILFGNEFFATDVLAGTIQIEGAILSLEMYDTPAERVKGLSRRKYLPADRGVLFVHEEPGMHGYWMKDMRFPVDILWIDADFRVVEVAHNISPDTYPISFRPASDALYVLETNAGWASAHNVTKGSEVAIDIP